MIELFVLSLLLAFTQGPLSSELDPAQPESATQLSMPGDTPTEDFGEPPSPEHAFFLTGTLVAIEPELVTLRRRGEIDADLVITSETSILLEGESVTFDEIPLGSEVEIEFVLRGVERVALEIRVFGPE